MEEGCKVWLEDKKGMEGKERRGGRRVQSMARS